MTPGQEDLCISKLDLVIAVYNDHCVLSEETSAGMKSFARSCH